MYSDFTHAFKNHILNIYTVHIEGIKVSHIFFSFPFLFSPFPLIFVNVYVATYGVDMYGIFRKIFACVRSFKRNIWIYIKTITNILIPFFHTGFCSTRSLKQHLKLMISLLAKANPLHTRDSNYIVRKKLPQNPALIVVDKFSIVY